MTKLCVKHARLISLLVVLSFVLTAFTAFTIHTQNPTELRNTHNFEPISIPVKHSGVILSGYNQTGEVNAGTNLSVMVTLGFNNPSLLNWTLNQLQNPYSPMYHKYLTKSEFISEFSPSPFEYNSYVNFFRSQGLSVSKTYADRISFTLSSNISQLEHVFHTNIVYFNSSVGSFYAPNTQLSVDANYGSIAGVTGLSNQFMASISPMFQGNGTTQVLYGADLQTAYQLNTLYQKTGYPVNETIATILWSGQNKNGTNVAPFVPSDVSTYLNNHLPVGQPRSAVYGDPVGGAPLPGPSAANDTTQANYESTLDLEMAGSTAPGATIVEVYGPQATQSYLDQAFAEILNPSYNTTIDNALSHVAAISNSWGSTDTSDPGWNQYEQEAAALGITVLAASGDSGNSNNAGPSFPATSANNSYGTLAVGGTQTTLSGTQSENGTGTTGILTQAVWYNSPNTGDGSQGGVSAVYAEPSWQQNSSDANTVIFDNSTVTGVSSGRGTPDIAGVGANMETYISTSSGPGYLELWGTSIASPLVAGVIATLDSYLGINEGFLNPLIYKLGQEQYQNSYAGPPPFYFIYNGSNAVFSSAVGYNLVDGWGSINAYNFALAQQARYNATFNETGLPAGTLWKLQLSDGSSFNSTSSGITVSLPNGTYSYTASTALSGASNITGSFTINGSAAYIQLPFHIVTYDVNFSETGLPSGTPWYVNISGLSGSGNITSSSYSVLLTNGTYSYTIGTTDKTYSASPGTFQVNGSNINVTIAFSPVNYSVVFGESGLPAGTPWYVNITGQPSSGVITSPSYTAPLTNGTYTYTVSTSDKVYSANGGTFTVTGTNTTVDIVFSKVTNLVTFAETGLPSGTAWYVNLTGGQSFSSVTPTITVSLPNGSFTYSISSVNKIYSAPGGSFTVSGNPVNITVTFNPVKFQITFTESGLPTGTSWYITLNGNTISSNNSAIIFSETNGTYSYTTGTTDTNYNAVGGTVKVDGSNQAVTVTFLLAHYTVTFTETGLPVGSTWYVNITGQPTSGPITSDSYSASLMNGSYSYRIGSVDKTYIASGGAFTVSGSPVSLSVHFNLVTYSVTFSESKLPKGNWYVNTTGHSGTAQYGSSISLFLPNGTYTYTVQTDFKNYAPSPSSGTFTVSGADLNIIGITFSPVLYQVTFVESGLPSGSHWEVNFTSETSLMQPGNLSSYSQYATVFLTNGTYTYKVSTVAGYSVSGSGQIFTVSGSQESINIVFSKAKYDVKISEHGIGSGGNWGIAFQGSSYYVDNTSMDFSLPNGTYSFTPVNSSLYYSQSGAVSFTVSGAALNIIIDFLPYSFISANINPINAIVLIDGNQINTLHGSFNVSLLPGIHKIVVSQSGYKTYYSNVTTLSGKALNLNINLVSNANSSNNLPSNEKYIVIAFGLIVPVAVIATYLRQRKK